MSRSHSPQRTEEEGFEEFVKISQEEGLNNDITESPFENQGFSIPSAASRAASNSNSNTSVELNMYTQRGLKRKKKAPSEDKGVSGENLPFTVISPIETDQAKPSLPRLPSFELPFIEIKPERPEPSIFPYTQRPRDNDEQEVQVDQTQEAPTEASQAHTTDTATREANTTGRRRRHKRVHLHIYFVHGREDRALTNRMKLVLCGLKIILVLTILYYLYARDTASPERPFQKRKLYIIHSG